MKTRLIPQILFLLVVAGTLLPVRGRSQELRPQRIDQLTYYPCSDCHSEMVVITTPRELVDEHDTLKLDHGFKGMWCLTCHSATERDSLIAYGGTVVVGFNDSQELCGSCHGTMFRDWTLRLHGKATGSWVEPGPMWLCVECHDPHVPAFKSLAPMPPPRHPRGWRGSGHSADSNPEGVADHER